jgi:hypothetical protein
MKYASLFAFYLLSTIVSCDTIPSESPADKLEQKLIHEIIGKSPALNLESVIITSRPSAFQQTIEGDTMFIKLNGFLCVYKPSPTDRMLYSPIRDSMALLSNRTLKLTNNLEKLPIISLDSANFSLTSSELKLHLINWKSLKYRTLVSITEPIANDYGSGLIGLVTYSNGKLEQSIYDFTLNDLTTIQRIQCKTFEPLGYFLDFQKNQLNNIYHGRTIFKGNCD